MTLIEILTPILLGVFAVILWGAVLFAWCLMYTWARDMREDAHTAWAPDPIDYFAVAMCALLAVFLTLAAIILTLSALGVEI